jgi:hypothetical protein
VAFLLWRRTGGVTILRESLEAQPGTHRQLQQKLRNEFENHKIISFSSSEQE